MSNSQTSRRIRVGKFVIRGGLAALVGAGGLALTAGVAAAHHTTLTATTSCVNAQGQWTVTWKAENSEDNKVMNITDVDLWTDDNNSGPVNNSGTDPSFAPSPVPAGGSATAVSTSPFGNSGTIARVRLQIDVSWSGGYTDSDELIVYKPGACPATTTTTWATTTTTYPTTTTTEAPTTTTTEAPTTTTTAKETTTTTAEETTTTTAPATTTTGAQATTTSTVQAAGGTVTTAPTTTIATTDPAPTSELPRTGSASVLLAILGVLMLAGGSLLVRVSRPNTAN